METPQLEKQIANLRNDVAQYTNITIKKPMINVLSIIFKFYIYIPLGLLILLLILRPRFVYHDEINKQGQTISIFSFKKLVLSWVICSLMLIIGVFAYNYNKKI
jgi:hypothetical protein